MASPARTFSSSYLVSFDTSTHPSTTASYTPADCSKRQRFPNPTLPPEYFPEDYATTLTQLVHVHGNGLTIVTAGNLFSTLPFPVTTTNPPSVTVTYPPAIVEALAAPPTTMSVKKLNKKQQKNNPSSLNVSFASLICTITVTPSTDGSSQHSPVTISLLACCTGRVMSLNNALSLTPELLYTDTSGTGIVAVIKPGGRFPPMSKEEKKEREERERDKKRKADKLS